MREHLEKEFNYYESKFIEILNTTNNNISEVTFSIGQIYNVLPFDYQRSGFTIGKKIKKKCDEYQNCFKYDFDQKNRLIHTQASIDSLENAFTSTFYLYLENEIIILYYDYDEELKNVTKCFIQDGRIVKTFMRGQMGSKVEYYTYVTDLLQEIKIEQYDVDSLKANTLYHSFIYDRSKNLKCINKYPEDRNYTQKIYTN